MCYHGICIKQTSTLLGWFACLFIWLLVCLFVVWLFACCLFVVCLFVCFLFLWRNVVEFIYEALMLLFKHNHFCLSFIFCFILFNILLIYFILFYHYYRCCYFIIIIYIILIMILLAVVLLFYHYY